MWMAFAGVNCNCNCNCNCICNFQCNISGRPGWLRNFQLPTTPALYVCTRLERFYWGENNVYTQNALCYYVVALIFFYNAGVVTRHRRIGSWGRILSGQVGRPNLVKLLTTVGVPDGVPIFIPRIPICVYLFWKSLEWKMLIYFMAIWYSYLVVNGTKNYGNPGQQSTFFEKI
jgi:hypothetical protein